MTVSKKSVTEVIGAEIRWHRSNPGSSHINESFENGFIAGLKQARSLVRKLQPDENAKPTHRRKGAK